MEGGGEARRGQEGGGSTAQPSRAGSEDVSEVVGEFLGEKSGSGGLRGCVWVSPGGPGGGRVGQAPHRMRGGVGGWRVGGWGTGSGYVLAELSGSHCEGNVQQPSAS